MYQILPCARGKNFYPRPPRGGRPHGRIQIFDFVLFLSTPSARRATRPADQRRRGLAIFLSTPSARRATAGVWAPYHHILNFYPRPPRGGRPPAEQGRNSHPFISIHALREEGDYWQELYRRLPENFYPRPPRGGRQHSPFHKLVTQQISIHALREEGDASRCCCGDVGPYFYPRPPRGGRPLLESVKEVKSRKNFYPRPPRGGRRGKGSAVRTYFAFLSTPSARRATG